MKFKIKFIDKYLVYQDKTDFVLLDSGSPASFTREAAFGFQKEAFKILNSRVSPEINMVRGANFLLLHKVIIDYPKSTLEIVDEIKDLQEYAVFDLQTVEGNFPKVQMRIGRVTRSMILDTGAKISYMKGAYLVDGVPTDSEKDFYKGAAGSFEVRMLKLMVEFAGRRFGCPFGVARPEIENILTRLDADGVAGYDLLKHFKIALDLRAEKLYVKI